MDDRRAKWAEGMSRRGLAVAAGLLPVMGLIGIGPRRRRRPESTFDRVRRTKVLRIAALPGELPYFQKDLATGEWSRRGISMAQDIAKVFDAKLEYIEFDLWQLGAGPAVQQGRPRLRAEPDAGAGAVDRVHPSDDHPSVRLPGEEGPGAEDLGRPEQAGADDRLRHRQPA